MTSLYDREDLPDSFPWMQAGLAVMNLYGLWVRMILKTIKRSIELPGDVLETGARIRTEDSARL